MIIAIRTEALQRLPGMNKRLEGLTGGVGWTALAQASGYFECFLMGLFCLYMSIAHGIGVRG